MYFIISVVAGVEECKGSFEIFEANDFSFSEQMIYFLGGKWSTIKYHFSVTLIRLFVRVILF
jgi:hypothetical protein